MKIDLSEIKNMEGIVLYACSYEPGKYGKAVRNMPSTAFVIKDSVAHKYNARLKKINLSKKIDLKGCHIFDDLDECNSHYISLLRS